MTDAYSAEPHGSTLVSPMRQAPSKSMRVRRPRCTKRCDGLQSRQTHPAECTRASSAASWLRILSARCHEAFAGCHLAKIGAISADEGAKRVWPEASAALNEDNKLAEGYISRGILLNDFDWNWLAAESDYRKALKLDPNNAAAHQWYARLLAQSGRSEEALREIVAAEQQDPLSPMIQVTKAKLLFVARNYNDAVEPCRKAIELEPGFASAYSMLGQIRIQRGETALGIEAVAKFVDLSNGNGWSKLELAYAHAVAGNQAEVERLVKEATAVPGQFSPYDIATIHSAQNDAAGALQWLQKAIEQRSVDVIWIRVDPRLDYVRSDPQFNGVLSRLVPRR